MAKKPDERIVSLREKIAKKQAAVEMFSKTLANTQKNIEAAKKTIEGCEKQISALEADMLAKALHKKGIRISDVAAAIEAGLFDSPAPEKPPDKTETEPETTNKDGATYSTENTIAENSDLAEKEDLSNE